MSISEPVIIKVSPYRFIDAVSKYEYAVRAEAEVSFRFVEGKSFKQNIKLMLKRQCLNKTGLAYIVLVGSVAFILNRVAGFSASAAFVFIIAAALGVFFRNTALMTFKRRLDHRKLKQIFKEMWESLPAAALNNAVARQVAVDFFTKKYNKQIAEAVVVFAENSAFSLKDIVKMSLAV